MSRPQAVIRIVPKGGARTARQIQDQLKYLSREGAVDLERSARHQGVELPYGELEAMARSWAEETGNYQPGQPDAESSQDLTTHIIVSFPRTTDRDDAYAASRAWVERMFGSAHDAGKFDYITAFHVDREHPHLHVVVNRRALEGHWLKISRRHPHFNYDNMRDQLVVTADANGIDLEATSRAERGIEQPAPNYAEFRRQQRRAAIAVRPEPEPDIVVTPRATPEPPELGDNDGAGASPQNHVANDFAMDEDFRQEREDGDIADAALQDIRQGLQDDGSVGPRRRTRQHRRFDPIETRAQRAAREKREADERARRHRRGEPEPEDLDPNKPRRLRSGRALR